ncbi:hypothetical protein [Paenibacillus sp. FJAT-27812]|uniref:hypothetical protein n=1 Tax=Paenibacillus sp. FJAT-27812 TaxID=1684143 RepID=UPI000A6F7738|nr:hypothetical protein [Paenibacillus sp. FJAT-27812]
MEDMKLEYAGPNIDSCKKAGDYFAKNQAARRLNHLFCEEMPVGVYSNILNQGEVRVH